METRSGENLPALLVIFLPFAAGYFLSYLFRTINGPISDSLVAEFGLSPRALGALTSLYFLMFAAFQIPAGLLIDRYGPRRVQASLLVVAAVGSTTFALASGPATLMLGRALIGLGTSAALVTGLKAILLWLPESRRTSANAWLVACGGLGATASTVSPLETVANGQLSWRAVFVLLAGSTALVAGLVWRCAPDQLADRADPAAPAGGLRETLEGLAAVFRDARFWHLAPLSALVVGTVFAVHGLWAARWLGDVRGLSSGQVAAVLRAMGLGLSAGAALFGALAAQARRRGITIGAVFGACCLGFMAIETAIMLVAPLRPFVLLGAFGAFGAITVLSFSIVGGLFPASLAGRANGALNVLHLGTAFVVQAGIGAVVSLWPQAAGGHVPARAYAAAIGSLLAAQTTAFVWFILPRRTVISAAQPLQLPGLPKASSK